MKAQIYKMYSSPPDVCPAPMVDILPSTITFENQSDIQSTLEKLFSAKFRFMSNGVIEEDGTFSRGLTVFEYYKEMHKDIPTEDIVIVPHAFYGSYRNRNTFGSGIRDRTYDDDIPLEKEGKTCVSIWIKEHFIPMPKFEEKKRIKMLYRCPVCGDTLTEEEYVKKLESGGTGYCLCRFSAIDEHGNVWYPREYVEYEVFTREEN